MLKLMTLILALHFFLNLLYQSIDFAEFRAHMVLKNSRGVFVCQWSGHEGRGMPLSLHYLS